MPTPPNQLDPKLKQQGWQRSAKGNLWQRVTISDHKEITVTVFQHNGYYKVCCVISKDELHYWDTQCTDEAKAADRALSIVRGYKA